MPKLDVQFFQRLSFVFLLAGIADGAFRAFAVTLSLSSATPTPGTNDIYNFAGASHDGANVSDGGTYADGAANDAFTYVAGDRADQGQTFTTSGSTNGCLVNAVWLRHVGYTNNTALTWWQMNSGVTLTVRITDPSQVGTSGFAVRTESYTTTGTEGWSGGFNSTNGDGNWLRFAFATPVSLATNKTYGFDLTSATTSAFFEWLGTSNNVFAGGSAYNGSTTGVADNALNTLVGDRVFLIEMASGANAPTGGTNSPTGSISFVAVPFDLTNVTLLPSQFQTNMLLDKAYLLSLDPDRLLYSFRANVGLSTSNAAPYGGWENPSDTLCLGHFVGHYLSACSMMYASTGDPQLKARTDYLVGELAKCQAASPAAGFNTGYLAAFPESYIDDLINETQDSYFSVPWYTLHKGMAGLLDVYQHTGNGQALTVLTNMANWVQFRLDQLTSSQIQAMLNYREYGGMNEVLANLSAVTGNTNYLRIAADFDKQSLFTPLSEDEDVLDGLHDNTQIPEIIGAAREYELTGSGTYQDIANFFWNRVADYRSYVIGGSGDAEFFFPTNDFPFHVDAETCETCCTYNILKLTRHLFEWSPSAATMDFYERALYNQILGSETAPGSMTYFVSLESGSFKTYSTTNNSFWCCDGTGVENHSKYGDTIYFHGTNSLYLNLFIPSQLNWPDKGLTVVQNTAFPQSDTTTLTFQCTNGLPLTLNIRYPSWAQSGMLLSINGVSQPVTNSPGSYVNVTRNWQNNDQVQIQLPMTLRAEVLQDTTNTAALFYGPILLAGALGTNGMPASDYAAGQLDLVGTAIPTVLAPQVIGDIPTLLSNTLPVPGQPLTFQTTGISQPRNINLIPFYQVQHQRYAVYWNVMSSAAWQQFANSNAVAEASIIDQVNIGDPTSEATHDLVATNSNTGNYDGLNWRDANENLSATGSFGYTMSVLSNVAMNVACTYWGSDSGNRVFDILVNGTIIATQTLTDNVPGQFFTVQYAIPSALTAGKTNVTVLFQAHSGNMAGGVFGLQAVTSADPGAFLGIALNLLPTQILGGSAQFVNVVDNFQNLTNHSIMSSPWLLLVSDNTNVVTIGPNNTLNAVGAGTATITASYLGQTVSQTVTVAPDALQINLSGTNVVISWPSNAATLQSDFNIAPGNFWSPMTDAIILANGTNSLTVPITNQARFFRLAH
jgi:hypothetical protein